jgi:hypothetical protein
MGPSRIPIVTQRLVVWVIYDGMDTFSTGQNRLETFEHEHLLLTLFAATNAHSQKEINLDILQI